ncbi:MAG: hypothetical protein KIT22_05275 [Verrucomicrobiae bacterium]|nr:hypothetical protein [Verrucomicrobiae bacterium]
MTAEHFVLFRNLALVFCVIPMLIFLHALLCREWVKRDLRDRICRPIQIRWRPFASNRITCSFKVLYCDFQGQIHLGICRPYWRDHVIWEEDEIVDHGSEAEA